MKKKHPIFEFLEKLAPLMPIAFYWLDRNGTLLGGNELVNKVSISRSVKKIIGRKYSDILPMELAEKIEKNIKFVVDSGKTTENEEVLTDWKTKKARYYLTSRSPLRDENGMTIGVLATTIEITDRKETEQLRREAELQKIKLQEQEKFRKIVDQAARDTQSPLAILLILAQQCVGLEKEKIFELLKSYTTFIPLSVYWLDANNKLVGANDSSVIAVGAISVDKYIGKTIYECFPYEMAEHIERHNNKVMRTGKVLSQEEMIKDITTGEIKHFVVVKAPLRDVTGNVVGVVGISTDITTEKNAESLKHEYGKQRIQLDEQKKFKKIADQVVHDIRSPLASLLMVIKSPKEDIPERTRITLRDAIMNINDIANNLLCRYEKEDAAGLTTEMQRPVMVALSLLQILSGKKHQYKEENINFTSDFCQQEMFVFIKAQPSAFKRMFSNLLNNAVEAMEGESRVIHLESTVEGDSVKIVVCDNGKGMSQERVDKLINGVAVASDKKDGHGIGFNQIRETLANNHGKLSVDSKLGQGTKMILTFPVIDAPEWMVKKVEINAGDTVVVLDDDKSIHGAWDIRFEDCQNAIDVKHFIQGKEAIDFINNFSEKDKIFLLTDYELLKQNLTGVDVIERTDVERFVLVTSHHSNIDIYDIVTKKGIKLLPKQLVSEIPLELCDPGESDIDVGASEKIDVVLIDDNEMLIGSMESFIKDYKKSVAKYYNPKEFLDDLAKHDKEAKIFIDNDFGGDHMSGIELAEQLRVHGFSKLYLLSGTSFAEGEVPDYLKPLLKSDIEAFCKEIE